MSITDTDRLNFLIGGGQLNYRPGFGYRANAEYYVIYYHRSYPTRNVWTSDYKEGRDAVDAAIRGEIEPQLASVLEKKALK